MTQEAAPAVEAEHGTYGAYQRHGKRSEDPCDPCKAAAAAYRAGWRARNPDEREKERQVTRSNSRALWRLAAMHPNEFRMLAADELAKERTQK